MKRVLKWTNKVSGETGFVKSVSTVRGYFVNTWDKQDAKVYNTDKQVNKDLETLAEVGETINNNFEAVEVQYKTGY